MTRYIADYASYQGDLTVAELHRAEFQVVNFKISHGVTLKAVHPRIKAELASARALGMGIGTFHWLIGNVGGKQQADYAYAQMRALGVTAGTMHTVDVEEQTGADDNESAPTFEIIRDYVLRMESLLGRPIALYTGDWWWTAGGRGWKGATLTPYLMAAPNAGYLGSYPGDASTHWKAGYGGWPELAVMQYAVDTLTYPGGGRSAVKVSKAAMRSEAPWRALTGGNVATRKSQNGWPVVLDREKITDPVLFGEDFPNGWLKGDVDVVFRYLIERLHREVEPIDFAHKADDWGYYVKDIEGSNEESNHSSGTAFDYNAHTHPMGVRNTYSEVKRRKIRAILADLHGIVRWGADYNGRPDDMHFEIDAPPEAVKREADRIRAAGKPQQQKEELPVEQAQFDKLMTAWAKSKDGQAALREWLSHDPGSDEKGNILRGGIPNPDPVGTAAGNTTLAPTTAFRDAVQARRVAESVSKRVDTLDARLIALQNSNTQAFGEILAAVRTPPATEKPSV